nr:hypothetical protein [Providencia stuartii]
MNGIVLTVDTLSLLTNSKEKIASSLLIYICVLKKSV